MATVTGPCYCGHMNHINKTTNDNIEARQDAMDEIANGLTDVAYGINCSGDCDDPFVFDEMVDEVIPKVERALAAATAIVGAAETGASKCGHMNSLNKTTNDNLAERLDLMCKVGEDLYGVATVAEFAHYCELSEFDERVGDMVACIEEALATAKAVWGA